MSWKDIVWKEHDVPVPDAQPHHSSPAPPAPVDTPVVTESSPVSPETPDADIYQRLVGKTDWESTPVFLAIKKHLAPMKDVAIDPKTKFTIALKQAMEMDGINPADVTAAFESAKANLQSQLSNFKQIVMNKTATDVDAKKKKAEELQQQVQQLTKEAFDAQSRLQTREHAFEFAAQQRLAEITTKQAEYSSLLS